MSIFSHIPIRAPRRTTFNLSYENKFSCPMGKLVPVFVKETVPGDRFDLRTSLVVRFAPMIAPIMQNIDVYLHYFYVPYRILNRNFDPWITRGEEVSDTNLPTPLFFNIPSGIQPEYSIGFYSDGSIADYLGVNTVPKANIPPSTGFLTSNSFNFGPFAAYHAIWLNYYRDENLSVLPNGSDWQTYVFYNESGTKSIAQLFEKPGDPEGLYPSLSLRNANYIHDYFTSALPFAQRGPTATVPIDSASYVPVVSNNNPNGQMLRLFANNAPVGVTNVKSRGDGSLTGTTSGGDVDIKLDPNGSMSADFTNANMGISIFDLRRTAKLQEWLEKSAYGGNRPLENTLVHFGVRVPDARLQRPEFLGGGRVPVSINDVQQTSASTDTSPQANPSGSAVSVGSGVGFRRKFFAERGVIMGIMSIMPRPSYQQGTARYLRRTNRFDFYWPEFAHIGEEPIYNYELYDLLSTSGNEDENNMSVFGYTPRYASYKFSLDEVHGDFRHSLNFWHMGRIFGGRPALNSDFLKLGTEADRVFAVSGVSNSQRVWCWCYHKCYASRLMPKFGVGML